MYVQVFLFLAFYPTFSIQGPPGTNIHPSIPLPPNIENEPAPPPPRVVSPLPVVVQTPRPAPPTQPICIPLIPYLLQISRFCCNCGSPLNMDHVYLTHSTRQCKNEASPGNVMNINNFANIQYKYPGLHTLVGFNFRNDVGSDFILAAEPNEVASFRSNPQYTEVDTLGYCSPGGGGQHCGAGMPLYEVVITHPQAPDTFDHFYTASAAEKDAVVRAGGRYVRIVCYLFIPEACC